jgi:hypothetical protein
MRLGVTETVGWSEVKRIADEIELQIHLAGMNLRDHWRDLRPRLVRAERELARSRARTSAAIERELDAIGGALRRLREDMSTPDP